uniref:Uncharacterized protein n=1 Tax=Chromera velia CCMP2878 TaxID=1169474 RepID=A0A0G4HC75_9ALVE|eukprot:Cvel_26011.t1-p1 / transcript=Cvel_26011.t1 / gene=Cvel_26011 / organism=Chromera_velia_CCMP2878 / gene_product=Ankyrin repeat and KH domain-containing protein, putative / transcript_product=Ankyrin repeat and KH domain-containing protein, putative / location=Cvel_scaffold3027:14715-16252(-) / protein_length=450 / sequence_SO=supercontig / SO=protein_coding / is_pseudo=false
MAFCTQVTPEMRFGLGPNPSCWACNATFPCPTRARTDPSFVHLFKAQTCPWHLTEMFCCVPWSRDSHKDSSIVTREIVNVISFTSIRVRQKKTTTIQTSLLLRLPPQLLERVFSWLPLWDTLKRDQGLFVNRVGVLSTVVEHQKAQGINPTQKRELDLMERRNCSNLYGCAKGGDHKRVVELLKEGVDPNKGGEDGFTPLMTAAEAGHYDVVRVLCKDKRTRVGEKNSYGQTALFLATQYNHKDVVSFLIGAEAAWLRAEDVKKKKARQAAEKEKRLRKVAEERARERENEKEGQPKPVSSSRWGWGCPGKRGGDRVSRKGQLSDVRKGLYDFEDDAEGEFFFPDEEEEEEDFDLGFGGGGEDAYEEEEEGDLEGASSSASSSSSSSSSASASSSSDSSASASASSSSSSSSASPAAPHPQELTVTDEKEGYVRYVKVRQSPRGSRNSRC